LLSLLFRARFCLPFWPLHGFETCRIRSVARAARAWAVQRRSKEQKVTPREAPVRTRWRSRCRHRSCCAAAGSAVVRQDGVDHSSPSTICICPPTDPPRNPSCRRVLRHLPGEAVHFPRCGG
jgi:hypothetical protein